MMMTPREAEALSVVHLRIVTVLDEVRVGVPPDRDAAFDHLRRLLAAAMAAEWLWQQPGSVLVHQRGRAPNHAAIAASVAYLEQAHRDSLDFVIEAALLEEIVTEHMAPGRGRWERAAGLVQRVATRLPADGRVTFQQLRGMADGMVRGSSGRPFFTARRAARAPEPRTR